MGACREQGRAGRGGKPLCRARLSAHTAGRRTEGSSRLFE